MFTHYDVTVTDAVYLAQQQLSATIFVANEIFWLFLIVCGIGVSFLVYSLFKKFVRGRLD